MSMGKKLCVLSTLNMMSSFFMQVSFPRTIIKLYVMCLQCIVYYVLLFAAFCPRSIKHRIIRFTFLWLISRSWRSRTALRLVQQQSLIRSNYAGAIACGTDFLIALTALFGAHNHLRHSSFRRLVASTHNIDYFCDSTPFTCVIWTQNVLVCWLFTCKHAHTHSLWFHLRFSNPASLFFWLFPTFFVRSLAFISSLRYFCVYWCASVGHRLHKRIIN